MSGKEIGVRRYSERTRQVLFLARAKAGIRGASIIDIGDLIWGIVVEDQMGFAKALSLIPEFQVGSLRSISAAQPAPSFLAAEAASRILQQLESVLVHSSPKSPESDIQMSSAVKHVLGVSRVLLQRVGGESVVTPLHLLAAVAESPEEPARILRGEDVTQAGVMLHLRERNR